MEQSLEKNIWKYTLLLITHKRIFIAILGAYYLTIPDVTPQTIGLILLAGNLSGFLFEIPSGYASDKIGHKHALVVSHTLILISTLLFLVADSVGFLMLGAIFLSTGSAFHSGTGNAFMHETLRALRRERDYTTVIGKISAIGFAVPIVFTVFVPFLVGISYKLPFLIAVIVDLIGLAAAISLTIPPVPQEQVEEIGTTNFKQVLKEGWHLNYFGLALFSGIVSGTLFGIAGFRAPYQVFLGIPVIWFGVLFGIGRALASLMLAYSGAIKKRVTLLSLYRFELICYTLLILVLGTLSTWWIVAIAFIIINSFQWGLSRIDNGFQLDMIRSSKFKATLLSTGSQIDQAVAGVASFGIGLMIERVSYNYGFLYTAVVFFAVLFPLYLYIARGHKAGIYKNTETVV